MTAPIGLQIHTIRELLREDPASTLRKVAEIGYVGIETGLEGNAASVELCQSLGLQVPGVLTGLPIRDEQRNRLDEVAKLGCRYVGIAWLPMEEFQSPEQIKRQCELLNEAERITLQHGLALTYHNHWWEFQPIFNERTPHEVMYDYLSPTVKFEIDVYWAQVGGSDPAQAVQRAGDRAPWLHIKDGPATEKAPMTAVGDGVLDIPAIIHAGDGHTQWLLVEMDETATDTMEAVEKSYRYLVQQGLGYGSKS